jgi:hypothetical protein
LNPGVSRGDFALHRNTTFQRNARKWIQTPKSVRYHQYLTGEAPGAGTDWWARIAGPLIRATSAERVAESILAVEFFPYHSRKYDHATVRLPSQAFTLQVVRRALGRKSTIILCRGERSWFGALPELAHYRGLLRLRNAQNSSISPGNLSGPANFAHLCSCLSR